MHVINVKWSALVMFSTYTYTLCLILIPAHLDLVSFSHFSINQNKQMLVCFEIVQHHYSSLELDNILMTINIPRLLCEIKQSICCRLLHSAATGRVIAETLAGHCAAASV